MSSEVTPEPLSLRRLLQIYVPLALSWLMMAAESPICTRMVNSLPDQRVQVAAMLALFSMALFIESPVIDLLATSTTLARTKQSFAAIRKFSVWMMAWCGVIHLLVATTPLFDVVFRQILNLPHDVAEAVRLPMLIMVPWSPAIGWRRHVQGLLIRNGVTRPIGIGTSIRVGTIIVVAFAGFLFHKAPGAVVAAVALATSVLAEAVFIHYMGRKVLRTVQWPETGAELNWKSLTAFHLPLTVSTMVMLTSMPLVTRALNQSANSLMTMNGWQVSLTLAFMLRTMTFALPEVVIANWKAGRDEKLLMKFCGSVGVALSGVMLLMSLTGLDFLFFRNVAKADIEVATTAHYAFMACSLLPILTASTSYLKGVLTLMEVTSARLVATFVSIAALAGLLVLGTNLGWPGIYNAAIALTVAQLTELLVLVGILAARVSNSRNLKKSDELAS